MVQTGLFPGWDDLLIAPQTQQGIYWNSQGTAPNRAVTFEWYTSRYGNNALYSHFLVSFYENMPNVTTIDYLNMTDSGISSTVGIQNGKVSLFSQYSMNKANLSAGTIISFNNTLSPAGSWFSGLPPGVTEIPGAIDY